jgi:Family of unknown function (DUF5926)
VSKRRKAPSSSAPAQAKKAKVRDVFVPRPFEGLADEPEWIALRELVPAATAPLELTDDAKREYGNRPVLLATVLPMAWPAMTKPEGLVLVGLQRHVQSGDPSRDLAVAILNGLSTEPGQPVAVPPLPGEGPRLQDILVNAPLAITMRDSFGFWLDNVEDNDPEVRASLERADASIYPTVRMISARAAYWCQVTERAHMRWVLPDDEDDALDALARLHAEGGLLLGENTKFAGMFRAHNRLVPVWDLPLDTPASDWESPVAEFAKRYGEALASKEPLSASERRARQGLIGRQITLR